MNFNEQNEFNKQCVEYESIIKDWIEFILKDIGYEILCDSCYDDKLEDEQRAAKSKNVNYELTQSTKDIASLFLKLAKENKKMTKAQPPNDAISVSTITDEEDIEETYKMVPVTPPNDDYYNDKETESEHEQIYDWTDLPGVINVDENTEKIKEPKPEKVIQRQQQTHLASIESLIKPFQTI